MVAAQKEEAAIQEELSKPPKTDYDMDWDRTERDPLTGQEIPF